MHLFIYLFIYFVATIPYNMAEAKGAILGTESMKDGDEVGKRQTYEYNATLVKIKAHNKIIHKVHTYHSSSIAALVESGMIVRVSGHQSLLQLTLECGDGQIGELGRQQVILISGTIDKMPLARR